MLLPRQSAAIVVFCLFALFTSQIHAQDVFTYQGELNDGGGPATGPLDLAFRLYDVEVGGMQIGSEESFPAFSGFDGAGRFTVQLDFGLRVFDGSLRWLEIWVDGAPLSPRQIISSAPMAYTAERVPDNAITNAMIADDAVDTLQIADNAVSNRTMADDSVGTVELINGAVTRVKIADTAVTSAKLADGSVTSPKLDDALTVGAGATSGSLNIWNGSGNQAGIQLAGESQRVSVLSEGGVPRGVFDAPAGGRLLLNDAADSQAISANADDSIESVPDIRKVNAIGDLNPEVLITDTASGGQVFTYANDGTALTQTGTSGNGGILALYQADGEVGVLASGESAQGGEVVTYSDTDDVMTEIGADSFGGIMRLYRSNGEIGVQSTGKDSASGNGLIEVFGALPGIDIRIDGQNSLSEAQIVLNGLNGSSYIGSGGDNRINGPLGIERDPLVNELEVDGSASKTIAGDWVANSDGRIKTDIRPVSNALETLDQVRPVVFRYAPEYLAAHPKIENKDYYNVVAQEFAEVFPGAVSAGGDRLPDGERILQVDPHPAMITALAAIQELHELVRAQEQRIADLEQRLAKEDVAASAP